MEPACANPHARRVTSGARDELVPAWREVHAQALFHVSHQGLHAPPRAEIPHASVRLEPHGRGQRPVGVESEVVHRSAVPFLAQKLLTRLDAPQAPRSVEAGGGDVIPGGMKRHPTQSIGVAA